MARKKVKEIVPDEVGDEKKILKEAEERERERKETEEVKREEIKKAEKEEKAEKAEKAAEPTATEQPKRLLHGKRYRTLAGRIEAEREYLVAEAIDLALQTSPAKFDATVELHAKVNEKEKNIRGTVTFPGGVAKEKRIFGATEKNIDELVAKVKRGEIDFDLLVADLKVMPKLAAVAKTLGPKGLMPSLKAGTAAADVPAAISELKGGKVEYRADKFNIVHMPVGKISFGPERIKQNIDALLGHLPRRIDSLFLTTSMGPSIKMDIKSTKK
ncbi:MAG: hypothetical protein AAB360_01620 [Patescibacteria group bacterium]